MADILSSLALLSFATLSFSLLFAVLKLINYPANSKKMDDILNLPAQYSTERGRFQRIILAIITNFLFVSPEKFKKTAFDLFVLNIIAKISIAILVISMIGYSVIK